MAALIAVPEPTPATNVTSAGRASVIRPGPNSLMALAPAASKVGAFFFLP